MFFEEVGRTIVQDAFELYTRLVLRSLEDQYRGHEHYELIKTKITKEGVVGGQVTVKVRNPDKSFRTVTYELAVMEDLGNLVRGVEDIAGQCVKGEIVKHGYLFTCVNCHKNFCMKHVRFFHGDRDKPLCTVGWFPCFDKYRAIHDKHEELEYKRLITLKEAELAEAITWRNRAVRQAEEEKRIYEKNKRLEYKGSYVIKEAEVAEAQTRRNRAVREAQEEKYKLKDLKNSRPGFFDRLLVYSAPNKPVVCPNCDWGPATLRVTCPSCGIIFRMRSDSSRQCPSCGFVVREIPCIRCNKLIPT